MTRLDYPYITWNSGYRQPSVKPICNACVGDDSTCSGCDRWDTCPGRAWADTLEAAIRRYAGAMVARRRAEADVWLCKLSLEKGGILALAPEMRAKVTADLADAEARVKAATDAAATAEAEAEVLAANPVPAQKRLRPEVFQHLAIAWARQ